MQTILINLNHSVYLHGFVVCLSIAALLLPPRFSVAAEDELQAYTTARKQLVETIRRDVEETSYYLRRKQLDPKVLTVIGKVPRHEFVLKAHLSKAYANHPLPIGHGQTISQPYIVAIMTDFLDLQSHHKVLEVGTGSGYQAAVLAELVNQVYTIEIIEPLGTQAQQRLQRLEYKNIEVRNGDGYFGWHEYAPFDAIIVTAAASHVPPPLVQQLKPGGKMMIPVGTRFSVQQLVLIQKDTDGTVTTRQVLPVRFVPLTGEH